MEIKAQAAIDHMSCYETKERGLNLKIALVLKNGGFSLLWFLDPHYILKCYLQMSMAILAMMIVSCEEFECWGDITNFLILLLKLFVGRNCLKIPGRNIIATFNYDTFTKHYKIDRKMSKKLF